MKTNDEDSSTTSARNEVLSSFIRDFGSRAHDYAYRLTGNEIDATDLVQESLFRVVRKWRNFDADKPIAPWVFRVMRNAFTDMMRRYDRRMVDSLDSPDDLGPKRITGFRTAEAPETRVTGGLTDGSPDMLSRLEAQERIRGVGPAVEALPVSLRPVAQLYFVDRRSYRQVARILGVCIGTVSSRIQRTRMLLRERLAEFEPE